MLKLRQQNYYYNIDILKCKDFVTNSENMKTFLYQSMTNITRKRYVNVIAGFQYILNGVFTDILGAFLFFHLVPT